MRTKKTVALAEFLDKTDPRVLALLRHIATLEDCILLAVSKEERTTCGEGISISSDKYREILGLPKWPVDDPGLQAPFVLDDDDDWALNPKFEGTLPL